jgi:hypothetical protein
MINKESDPSDMFFDLFTERHRLPHQIGATLASRLVKAFDMGGFP